MKINKYGDWKYGCAYFHFINTSDHKKCIETEWLLWNYNPVWFLLPTLIISGFLNNFMVTFQFLKFRFKVQWSNWKNPHTK